MAQNISLLGATYSAVPAVTLPKSGGGSAMFIEETELANAGTQTPLPDAATGSAGSATAYSREDHVHPEANPWVEITLSKNTSVGVKLANNGFYLFVLAGNANDQNIGTTFVGSSGNTTHVIFGGNTTLTVTDGSGTGVLTLKYTGSSASRNVYFLALNGATPARLNS